MMDRRAFIVGGVSALAAPLAAAAQQGTKIPRIGVLGALTPEKAPHTQALREGLYELGYVEGRDIVIEWRWAEADPKRFPRLAAELLSLNVNVIVADNNPAIAAAQKATRTIPIVMVVAPDPVGMRFVASLARPGGNITGLSYRGADENKQLQLLREAVPTVSRVAILWDPTEPGRLEGMRRVEAAIRDAGAQAQPKEVRSSDDLEGVFAAITRERAGAIVVQGSSMMFAERARIGKLLTASRLPAVCGARGYVEAGCLLAYSANFSHLFRRAATYVDKILKGAKPADLPVEQPMRLELVINLKTARALGLTIPPSLLLRADQIIE